MDKPYHIDLVCFANRSGYAQAAQDYVDVIKKSSDYRLHLTLMHTSPDQLAITPERYREMMSLMDSPLEDDNFVQIFHCIPDMQRRAWRGVKSAAFATFETQNPPEHWVEILNSNNDAVIVVSKFNEDVFRKAGVTKPIHYIPHVVNTDLYHVSAIPNRAWDRFTFLYMGTWKQRKGWRELIEAWFREFSLSDNVQLVIKTDKLSVANREIAEVRKNLGLSEKETAPILFETKILNELELPRFLKSADCLVCPTYGEGFGLPGLQCMALGVPVIVTDYSGCQDYANEDTATLLKPSGFILYNEMDGIPQFRNKKWAHVSVESVKSAMRHVQCNTDIVKQKALRASEMVAEKFNYDVALQGFNRMMESIE